MVDENNERTKRCLSCNKERPLDFFVGEERICWACKVKHLGEPEDPEQQSISVSRELRDEKPMELTPQITELVRVASLGIEKKYCSRGCRYYKNDRAFKCDKLRPRDDGSISCYGYAG